MAFDNDRAAERADAAITPTVARGALSDGMRARILLADDDDNVRGLSRRLLALQGWDVVATCNGREAVDAWPEEGTPFDLVILDMNMPVMSGLAAYEELRRQHPEMVVLFVSGSLQDLDERGLILKGRIPFLAKPFTPQQLVATAAALLACGRPRVEGFCLRSKAGVARASAHGVV